MASLGTYLSFVLVICLISPAISGPLKVGFYQKKCPSAEAIVRESVQKALAADPGVSAALIRLHFHDCFVRGCDGSILLDSTKGNTAEKDSMGNLGIGGFEVIDDAKAKIEAQCPYTVSCADIVAFAARDCVRAAGGSHYAVFSGRRDGRVSLASEVIENLPGAFFNAVQLKENFAKKGLSLQDMVTLSGAHSIGDSHCSAFTKRLYSFNSTYSQDPSLNPSYAHLLKTKCPRNGPADPVVPFDPVTPNVLDNAYYNNLKSDKGLLYSDQVLWDTPLTRGLVKDNANHPSAWARRFMATMVRMGSIEVLTGAEGEIRKNCRVIN
ncbi:peroxidase 5-like [Syzygium oleosum]|uniref:peroxidase 5-like n=1 Tax=Syzygium oleosum TaxID=219896 RepID=UPI0024B90BBE|nr:peroxidase 5-like [Syzygium oleosum]